MNKKDLMNKLSKYWLEEIVIGLDLCPFAKIPYEKGLVRFIESECTDFDEQRGIFLDEIELINESPDSEIATTLIAFTDDGQSFLDFNDFIGVCEEIIEDLELQEDFQLALFHPEYVFEKTQTNDRINFIGRSPFPVIHILRNADIERATKKSTDGESITIRNEKRLKALSEDEIKKIFHFLY